MSAISFSVMPAALASLIDSQSSRRAAVAVSSRLRERLAALSRRLRAAVLDGSSGESLTQSFAW